MPLFGFCLSKYIIAIGAQKSTEAEIAAFKSEADHWTLIFFFFTLAIGSCTYVQRLSFGIGGDNLSYTLRIKLFGAILRKHIGWFDSKDHAPGILTNILIEDISKVNGLTTESLAIMIEAGLGLGAACFLCFFFSAKVAIVVTLISPFMALGGVGMSKLGVNSAEVDTAYKAANAMLSDLVLNYKTVITFGEKNVETLLFRYSELLIIPHKAGVKRAHISGLFFGYSQAIRFIFVGVVFYVAAVFLNADPTLDSNEVYTGCYMVFVGAIGAGVALSFMPSMSAAKQSAKKVFGIIEEQSVIDPR
jgi:ABC-type multidrug transport system fused ATPase/permease subunit